MFSTIALFFALLSSPATKSTCEDFTRWDATTVTVCSGHVVSVRDDLGNSRKVGQ